MLIGRRPRARKSRHVDGVEADCDSVALYLDDGSSLRHIRGGAEFPRFVDPALDGLRESVVGSWRHGRTASESPLKDTVFLCLCGDGLVIRDRRCEDGGPIRRARPSPDWKIKMAVVSQIQLASEPASRKF